jgi:hypothetical protein
MRLKSLLTLLIIETTKLANHSNICTTSMEYKYHIHHHLISSLITMLGSTRSETNKWMKHAGFLPDVVSLGMRSLPEPKRRKVAKSTLPISAVAVASLSDDLSADTKLDIAVKRLVMEDASLRAERLCSEVRHLAIPEQHVQEFLRLRLSRDTEIVGQEAACDEADRFGIRGYIQYLNYVRTRQVPIGKVFDESAMQWEVDSQNSENLGDLDSDDMVV